MKTSIIISLMAALPLLAQDAAPTPESDSTPQRPQPRIVKFEGNKEAVKAALESHRADMQKKMLEKFDTNKDGQLDDSEKQAMKVAFETIKGEMAPRGPRGEGKGHGKRGPRGEMGDMGKKMLEKFDTNKDGQLDDSEKQAMKAAFEARKGEMGPKGPRGEGKRGPKGEGKGMSPGANNKRGHWQGPRTKMPRNPKDAANKPATLEIPQE